MMAVLALVLLSTAGATRAAAPPPPNIVIFLADDLGWKDIGYHDSEIKTPHLDALANGGVRLEQFYVQPVCSPTRSSLMTGRYPLRMGLQVHVIRPYAQYGLPLEERTLPAALKEVGYETAIVGKWHLGMHTPVFLPTRRGFDHQYGHYCGALDYWTHNRDGGHDWHRDDKANYDEGYTTNLIGDECVRLIAEHNVDKPLLLYVPFNAPHAPLQAPDEYLAKYKDIRNKNRKSYAAMVDCVDTTVGRVVDALKRRGMRDNTLILFSSDNGGPEKLGANNGPLRGQKGTLYEGGVRVPAFANWPKRLKPAVVNEPLHIVDWYPTLLTLAGASLDQPLPLDGKNAWDTIAQGAKSPRTEIVHNVEPTRAAIRMGDWKLIEHGADGAELFNIASDPGETTNLADEQPQKRSELHARL
ncbi:MAG: arylsulfatase, partial [Planctomycetales bacterium]|nr:arylsulfatase [Planctomycetales bacterium]